MTYQSNVIVSQNNELVSQINDLVCRNNQKHSLILYNSSIPQQFHYL